MEFFGEEGGGSDQLEYSKQCLLRQDLSDDPFVSPENRTAFCLFPDKLRNLRNTKSHSEHLFLRYSIHPSHTVTWKFPITLKGRAYTVFMLDHETEANQGRNYSKIYVKGS